MHLTLALSAALLASLSACSAAAQQINYVDFNTPQAAASGATSTACPAATNILFCVNYSGAGPSFIQDLYPPFLDPNAAFDNDAGSTNYAFQLNPNAASQDSSVWYSAPQDVVDGFTTWYTVKIKYLYSAPNYFTGDGMAFVIQKAVGGQTDSITNSTESGSGPTALGAGGGGLGYGGIDNSVALEMDTFWDSYDPQQSSQGSAYDDNHIALQGCGLDGNGNPIANSPAHLGTPNCLITLGNTSTLITNLVTSAVPTAPSSAIYLPDGNPHQIVMVYNGPNDVPANYMWVYLDAAYNPGTHTPVAGSAPLFSGPFDITKYMKLSNGGPPYSPAYVGFTAGTGGDYEQHELMAWTFMSHAGPQNFGNVNVCPSGQTTPAPCTATLAVPFQFSSSTALGSIQVVTQGTSALDFNLASGSTCTGTVAAGGCVVNVTFAPLSPGIRLGAVRLLDGSGNLLATTLIYGVGQAPAVAFNPTAQTTVNVGTYQLSQPKGLATDAAGNLYIADTGVHYNGPRKILKIAPDGTQSTLGSGLTYPQGIAIDGAGDLFVADNDLNQVIKIPAGCTSSSCQQVLPTPQCFIGASGVCAQLGVAVDGPGNVFIASFNSQVLEIPANGGAQIVLYSPTGSQPVGIAVDSAGDLFITDIGLHRVVEVPTGCTIASCQTLVGTGWYQPNDVAVDAAGDVFVTDGGLQKVIEVPVGCASASCQIVLASGFATGAITVNAAGDVFVDDLSNNTIVRMSRSQPPTLNFAATTAGSISSDSPQSVALQNIGNQPLTAETPGLLLVAGPNFASVPGPGTFIDCSQGPTIAPGAECNLSVSFQPQSAGTLASAAVFHDNALNANIGVQTVNLNGTGLSAGYTIGGTVTGLTGAGLVLENNLSVSVPVTGNGSFTFPATVPIGSTYNVTVFNQPLGQACTVVNGSGLVQAGNVTSVQVNCANLVYYALNVTAPGTGAGTVQDSLGQIGCIATSGGLTGTCSGSYPAGTPVTLSVNALSPSVFVGWGGDCSSYGAHLSCFVTVNSALNVSASFVAPPATPSSTLSPVTAGVVYGQGGSFTSNLSSNGGVTANSLGNAQGMFVDGSGNLYVADGTNSRVLFYPAGSTTPTRVYGQGGSFTGYNPGTTASSLSDPQSIAVDSNGNVYISDEANSRVLFYPAGSTTATRVYGQGGSFTSGLGNNGGVSANSLQYPIGVALDGSGNLYVADYGNSRILFYPAGSTTATRVYGQGGSFTSNAVNNGGISANSLNQPAAVALDSSNDLYAADLYNNRVLFYPANSTTATQVYGQGGSFTSGMANKGGVSPGTLNNPLSVAVDSKNSLYVADRSNNRVLYYPFGSTGASRVYGQSGSFNTATQNVGGVSANSLNQPWSVAVGSNGNPYIADYGNNRVLGFGSFGNVNACPANQATPSSCGNTVTFSYAPTLNTAFGATQVVTQGVTGLDYTLGSNTCTGSLLEGTTCTVGVNFTPLAPGLRSGAVELFDTTGAPLAATPLYGTGQSPVIAFGPGTPTSVPLTGFTGTPQSAAVDASGNVFISDFQNSRIVKVTPAGVQTTVAVSGNASAAGLDQPSQLAIDGTGNLFVANSAYNQIVEITPGGVQTIVATGFPLNRPLGVALDGAGDLFVADTGNSRVIEVLANGGGSVLLGSGLSSPTALAVDSAGQLYITDSGLKQVLKLVNGTQTVTANIAASTGLALDAAGDIYIGDAAHSSIVEVSLAGAQTTAVSVGAGSPVFAVDGSGSLLIPQPTQLFRINRSQPSAVKFATTNVGSQQSPQSLTVQNVGNLPLSGSLAFNLGANFLQNAATDCSSAFPLAPSAGCGENFSFAPQSATFLTGTATFTDNTLNSSPLASQTFTFTGTGALNDIPGTVAVPNVVGLAQGAATTPINAVGLAMGTVSTASSQTVPTGTIISENPVAGTQVAVGSIVNLLVSSGLPQPTPPNPLSLENNYFLTGDYVSAGVTLRGYGNLVSKVATGIIKIPNYTQSTTLGIPDGADIVDAFLYWESVENTAVPSSTNGTFNGYNISGQQIGADIPNFTDGNVTGTLRVYRASVNIYLPAAANGIRYGSGAYTVSLPDSGGTTYPLTEGASLVLVYRVLSPNFPLKSVVLYDGAGLAAPNAVQVVQGFYDAVGGANGTGKNTNIFATPGSWSNSVNSVTLGQSNQYTAPLTPAAAYAAVILSTPVNDSDNDGMLDAWKTGPSGSDFHAGQPGYYDAKTGTWVGLAGAKHGQKDLFVQLDYMCATVLATGGCDTTKENLFPSPDANGNDPLAMVQQAFAASGVQLHLTVGNAVPEDTCTDAPGQLCQFPNEAGVVGWKNSLEFSKLYPRNLYACLTGGDCTTRFPFGQKDSYHYVLFGHALAIPAWNSRFGSLISIKVASGVTTIVTTDRGNGINLCTNRITIAGVLGDPLLNGVYDKPTCADSKTITVATPGVPDYTYPNNTLPEPVIGITFGQVTSISGYSDLGGADSAVTLGLWLTAKNQDMSKKANVLAGTLFHEIGHTLGLSHGGLYYDTPNSYVPTFEANCKPNYQSIMNYLFQLDGVGPNEAIAFSNQTLIPQTLGSPTLSSLNEYTAASDTGLVDISGSPATFPTSAWYVPYATGTLATPATRHCDGTPLVGDSAYRVDAPISPITPPWSNSQDLNFTGVLQSKERGFNDLSNLDLRQVGATGGQFASLASLLSFGSSVAPLNIGSGGTVTLGSGGTVALGSGGTATLGSGGNVTLGSGGTIALTNGGTVTLGSGGNVTLGSGGGTITAGSSGTVTLGSGGTFTLGSGAGTVTLGSGGTVTLGSGGTLTLGSGGTYTPNGGGLPITISSTGGTLALGSGGTLTLGSGGTFTLGSGGTATLGSGGTVALGSGGTMTLGGGGTFTLGSGGTVSLGSGGTMTLGSGGNVTLGSGGTVTLGSGGTLTLGSGGTVSLGSGGTVTLGSGGNLALGSGGNVTLGSGGTATLGSGGTVTLGSGGTVTLGSGGTVSLGSGGTIALGSGGTATLGSGGTFALGSGGTLTLGSGGTVTLGSGGTITFASGGGVVSSSGGTYLVPNGGGTVTLGSGGTVTVGSGGTFTLGSGGTLVLGSGGTVALGSGGTVTLGSGGTVTLGSGGTVTLGSGGVVTLGTGGSVNLGTGSEVPLGTVSSITPGSGGPTGGSVSDELTYETANSVVRVPTAPTETLTPEHFVRINWKAPAFGVVQTYTIYRSSDGAAPIVIGSVSGVDGNPPATEFTDTNPDTGAKTVVYTIATTLVPDTPGAAPRQSQPSVPAVIKNDQSIALGPLPSSLLITSPLTATATALSGGVPNGLQVAFSTVGACSISSQSMMNGVSSASVALTGTGSCTVIAEQLGTTSFNAANSVSGTVMVLPQGPAPQSQTITFAPLPNAIYGGSFSLNASSSGLPVSFATTGPCTATGSISGVGICSVTASAPANGTYSAASVTQSFNIYPAVLKVTATNLASIYGQPLPALTYSYSGFVKGDTALVVVGAPALSTLATATSNAGSYSINVSTGTLATTNYSFLYVNGSLTIQPATQSALTLLTTSPLTYGQSETLSASGGTTNGSITYNLLGGTCSIAGARLTALSGTGSCQLAATRAGNSNYSAVSSAPVSVTLAPATQAIVFTTNPPTSAAFSSTFTVAATGGPSTNLIVFSSAGVCTNSGATYTMTSSVGTCSVIANQAGNSNYSAAPTVTKTVTATGPFVTVSPGSLNFGTVYQGSISAKTITVTNTGTTPTIITDPIISILRGGTSNQFVAINLCPRPLAAGSSCTMLIGFIAGPFYTPQTATLKIMDNAPGNPQTVAISALVINPMARLGVANLNFGTIPHGTASTVNVTLSNPGPTPLALSGISVTGANTTYFTQTNTCGTSLVAGGSCTIAVKFSPAAAGTFGATLIVKDNAQAGGGTQTVALSGKGS